MNNKLDWRVSDENLSARTTYAGKLGCEPLIGQMIANRGIHNIPEAFAFLKPDLRQLHKPGLMHDMEKAVARIHKAIAHEEKIAIFGDYDTDGITSASTLYHAFQFWGNTPTLYVPHRLNEGYGMNNAAITKLIDEGHTLIVSVDCGITAVDQAKLCKDRGIDLIITDHHEQKEELPDAFALVHPRLGDTYPNKELCGAGVAFKVAWALGQQIEGAEQCDPNYARLLQRLLCFTALGTIADVVPLIGENRTIATFGLSMLSETEFPGLRALIVANGLDGKAVDGYAVGFCLAPRLNAAGRMGHAATALGMLTSSDYDQALSTARELEAANRDRQATERAIVVEAKAQAAEWPDAKALVLVGKDWHSGVVGIVASRVIDDRYCPTIVLVDSDGELHGSCRSIEGFNLAQGLKSLEHLLTRWGGHAMAAGVKLKAENLAAFRAGLDAYVAANCPPELLVRRLDVDAWAELPEITLKLVKEMAALGPFGNANRRPVLAIKDAIIMDPKAMGKEGRHLMFRVVKGRHWLKCIAWNQGDLAHKIPVNVRCDVAVEPQVNEWQGRESVELLCRDIKMYLPE